MISRCGVLQSAVAVAVAGLAGRRDEVQSVLDEMAASAASAVLAEVRRPGQVWRGSSGVTELGSARPVAPGGRFRAGSVTKSFVAAVVLQLVGAGRLGLDQTVDDWLPGVVAEGKRITVRQLLQHTSGIVNYTNTRAFRTLYGPIDQVVALRDRTWTPQELLDFTTGAPLLFEPGTSWMYSNTNYILLGLLIQRVTGNSYAREADHRLVRRLRLQGTEFPGRRSRISGPHAHGYLPGPVDITDFNPSVTGASGELVSTVTDLNCFYRALIRGELLRPDQQRELLQFRSTGRDYDYGLGLQTMLVNGHRVWGHDGDIFGYQAASWTSEDGLRQLTVSWNPWGGGDPGPFVERLLTIAFPV